MTVSDGLGTSTYSKLSRVDFQQVVVAPSSIRLTVIERMEKESLIPDEIFLNYLLKSELNPKQSYKLPKTCKRTLSLK